MKTNNVNSGLNIMNISNKQGGNSFALKKEDVLSGVVESINDSNVSVYINKIDKNISLDKSLITQNISKGDTLDFKVKNSSSDKVELELINQDNLMSGKEMIDAMDKGLSSKEVFESYDYIESDDKTSDIENENSEDKTIDKLATNAYEQSIRKILRHENSDVLKLSLNEFMNMVVDYNQKSLEGLEVDAPIELETLPDELKKEVINKLNEIDVINNFTLDEQNQIALKMIKNDEVVTIDNLFESKYKINKTNKNNVDFNANNFVNDIKTILTNENVEITNENVEISKILISNEIDLTKNNVERFKEIKNAMTSIDKNDVMKNTIINAAYDTNDISVENNIEEKVNIINNSIDKILEDDCKINELISNCNIENISLKQVEEIAAIDDEIENINASNDQSYDFKLMLNETRLMLTTKSAYQMYSKGINLEVEPIKNVIKQLKEINNIETNINNASKLNEISEELTNLSDRNLMIFKDAISNIKHSIKEYSILNNEVKNNSKNIVVTNKTSIQELEKIYDSNMIESRYTLNSEHSIVKRSMPDILKMLNIENSEINQKCGLVLSLSDNEVTLDNINKIKNAEEKVDYIFNKLTPKVALSIIEDGIDVTTLDIDDAINIIDKKIKVINEEVVSKKQVELDNINHADELYDSIADMVLSKTITNETKDAMLGIYKVINKINKYSNAGLGILNYQPDEETNEINLTLREIFDATKVLERKQYGLPIDQVIGDAYGNLEIVLNEDKTIKNSLDKAFNELRKNSKNKDLLNDNKLIKTINEDITFSNENEDIIKVYSSDPKEITLEEIEIIKNFEESKNDIKENVMSDENLSHNENLKDYIDKNNGKIKNRTFIQKDEEEYLKELKKERNNDIKDILDEVVMKEDFDITKRIEESKQDALKRIESINKVLRMTDTNNKTMQTSLYINDEITNVNIYFDENIDLNSNENNMLISLDMEHAGSMQVDININNENKTLKLNYLTKNKDTVNVVKDMINEIVNSINEDYKVSELNINGKDYTNINEKQNMYIKSMNVKNTLSKIL